MENALSSDENIWVVLPTHDRKELLRESLTALRTQTHKPAHVLVVLNASPPEVTLMLESEFPEIELLRLDENLGSAGGFHFGIKRALEAGAGWVWLMDDDAIAEPDSLERLLTALKQVEVFSPDPDILLSRVV
ncbi:MAG: glycosyltransferase, partial [Deinococcus sp.]|nr:glycosyltransferase [Deinococcus sp.]